MFTAAQWTEIEVTLDVTHREIDVIRLILAHESEQEVARDLSIALSTVHSHMRRIYKKLDINCRSELIERVYEAHWRSVND